MSGLWRPDQPLWRHLQARGARTLFFAGVNTDQCVLGTLADAYNAGWDCLLVEDCCATTTEHGQDVCVWNVAVGRLLPPFSLFLSPRNNCPWAGSALLTGRGSDHRTCTALWCGVTRL